MAKTEIPVRETPNFLQRLHTDEYAAVPYTVGDQRAVTHTRQRVRAAVDRRAGVRNLLSGRAATAAGLRALNVEHGSEFFVVPPEAVDEDEAAPRSSPVVNRSSTCRPISWLRIHRPRT